MYVLPDFIFKNQNIATPSGIKDVFFCLSFRFVKAAVTTFAQAVQRDKPPNVAPYMVWGSKALNVAFNTLYSQFSGIR